jgi:hypothetical protein
LSRVPAPRPSPTLVSPRFDLSWFVLPGIVAAATGIAVGTWFPAPARESLGLWILGVLLVDVAHVYASLYRTYFDPQARRLHRRRLIWAPLLCAWFGFLLHLESSLLFWGVLAYVAIFHFIKQHLGFALLYARAGDESGFDRRLVTWAVWAGTGLPVVYWHANLPTAFAWFVEGDLLRGLPAWVGAVAVWLQVPVLGAFVARRLWLGMRGRANWMVPALALLPALNWNIGIVWFDDDRVFTITNVFFHGVPYLALVWVTGGRDTVERGLSRLRTRRPFAGHTMALVVFFYGLLVALACLEEGVWDRLVWHDHPELFGSGGAGVAPEGIAAALVVALLTVPQATHYLLDRWIWRVGPDNPRLAEQLGFGRPRK